MSSECQSDKRKRAIVELLSCFPLMQPPQDWHLLLGAVVMTLVSAVVLIFVAIFDDYTAKRVADKEKDSTRNVSHL